MLSTPHLPVNRVRNGRKEDLITCFGGYSISYGWVITQMIS